MALHLIPVSTAVQLVLKQGSWRQGGSQWRVRQPASVEKQAEGSVRDLGLILPNAANDRRIEVVAHGLPFVRRSSISRRHPWMQKELSNIMLHDTFPMDCCARMMVEGDMRLCSLILQQKNSTGLDSSGPSVVMSKLNMEELQQGLSV